MSLFTWTKPTVSGTGTNNVRALLNVPGTSIWVGCGDAGLVIRSTDDGVTWASSFTSETNPWRDVAYDGSGALCMVASLGTHRVAISTDNGVTWGLQTAAEANSWQAVRWNPILSKWIAVAQSGTHRVMTASVTGVTWTPQSASSATNWSSLAVNPSTGLMLASNTSSSTMHSTDAVTWTAGTLNAGFSFTGGGNNRLLWSTLLSKFAAGTANSSRYLSTTPDGITWTDTIFSAATGFGQMTSAPSLGGFVVPAATLSKIGYSTDGGASWTIEDSGINGTWSAGNWNDAIRTVIFWDNDATGSLLRGTDVVPPTIMSVAPPQGDILGGTPVTIVGTGFSGTPTVLFGTAPATSVVVVSSTRITCITPAHAGALVDVSASTATLPRSFTFLAQIVGTYNVRREPAISIAHAAGSVSTAKFKTDTAAPVLSSGINVHDPLISEDLFNGSIVDTTMTYEELATHLVWDATAVDYSYLLNRRRPLGSWSNTSAATIVASIMGFTSGFTYQIQGSLPAISISFNGSTTVTGALSAVAAAIGVNALGQNCGWSLDNRNVFFGYGEQATYVTASQDDKFNGDGSRIAFLLTKQLSYAKRLGQGYVSYNNGSGVVNETISLAGGSFSTWVFDLIRWGLVRLDGGAPAVGVGNIVVKYNYHPDGTSSGTVASHTDVFSGDGTTNLFVLTYVPLSFNFNQPGVNEITYNGSAEVGGFIDFTTTNVTNAFSGDGTTDTFTLSGAFVSQSGQVGVLYDDGSGLKFEPMGFAGYGQTSGWVYHQDTHQIKRLTGPPNASGPNNVVISYVGRLYSDVGTWVYTIGDPVDDANRIVRWKGGPPAAGVNNVEFVYDSFASTAPPAPGVIDDSNMDLLRDSPISLKLDVSQIRNRVIGRGVGTSLRVAAAIGDQDLQVQDASMFQAGSLVIIGSLITSLSSVTYSASAPVIRLNSALTTPLIVGSTINIYAQVNDTDAQTSLAKIEGGDGIHENWLNFTDWLTPPDVNAGGSPNSRSAAEYSALAVRLNSDLALFSSATASIHYATRDPETKKGRVVTWDLTNPPIVGEFQIHTVNVDQIHEDGITFPRYTVDAGLVKFDIHDLLRKVMLSSDGGGSSSFGGGTGGGGGIAVVTYHTGEVPSGAINGINTVFTLSHPYTSGSLDVYLNGIRLNVTADYAETSSTTFTMVVAPLTGDLVTVDSRQ